ncbi:MAG: hypothetical protein R3183_11850, partial [Oleiphilaceae bacterium]|nr:hypothetical protein [Oleiphilaceae bacterium]
LVVLSSICDGRILTLQSSQAVAKQHGSVLNRAIAMTELKIKQLGDALNQYDDNIRTVMLQMIREMEEKLFALGLDEDQEEALVQLAYDTTERLETLKGDTHKLEKELGAILEGLYELLAKDA